MTDLDPCSIFAPAGLTDTPPLYLVDGINEGLNFVVALVDALELIHKSDGGYRPGTFTDLACLAQKVARQIRDKVDELHDHSRPGPCVADFGGTLGFCPTGQQLGAYLGAQSKRRNSKPCNGAPPGLC